MEKKLLCPICLDQTEDDNKFIASRCGHIGHFTCTQGYVKSELEKRRLEIKCLKCVEEKKPVNLIQDNDVRNLVPDMIKQIDDLNIDSAIGDGMKYCIVTEECGGIGFQELNWFSCHKCKKHVCVQCKVPFERNHVCKTEEQKVEDQFRDLVAQGDMQKCPGKNCGRHYQKKDGCNHMKCPACKTDFCNTCGRLFVSYGQRCACNVPWL